MAIAPVTQVVRHGLRDVHVFAAQDAEEAALSTAFSSDGRFFATASTRGHIVIRPIDPKHASPIALSTAFQVAGPRGGATSVRFSDEPPTTEGYLCAAAATDGNVGLWRVSPGETVTPLGSATEADNEIMTVALTRGTANMMATGGSDSVLRLYDITEGGAISLRGRIDQGVSRHGQPTWGPPSKVMALRFAEEHLLIAAGWEASALLYDLRIDNALEPVRVFAGSSVSGDGLDLRGGTLLTVSHRQTDQIQLFSIGSGQELSRATVDILPSAGRFGGRGMKPGVWVAGSNSNAIIFVDPVSGKTVAYSGHLPSPVFGMDVSPVDPETIVAVGGSDTAIRLTLE